MDHSPVIRIVKKKVVAGGHHGGSWKVAYADFVTAMMAFFLVMWIISMDQPVREKIQQYFNDPASASNSRAGISYLAAGGANPLASGFAGAMDTKIWKQAGMARQSERMDTAKTRLEKALGTRPDLSRLKANVTIKVDKRGLLIEVMERSNASVFKSGSAQLPADSYAVLGLIAREVGKLPNPVVLEGHTDLQPYSGRTNYSNWELSTDRANAARRAMEAQGLRQGQVTEVRGYAATQLSNPNNPMDPRNRRVTVQVLWNGLAMLEADKQPVKPGGMVDVDILHTKPPVTVDHMKIQPHL